MSSFGKSPPPGGGSDSSLSSTATTTADLQPTMKGHDSTSSPLPSQTSGTTSGGSGSLAFPPDSDGASRNTMPTVIVFHQQPRQVFDLSHSTGDGIISFSLANSTVQVRDLAWYVNSGAGAATNPSQMRPIASAFDTNPTMLTWDFTRSVDKDAILNLQAFQANNSNDYGQVMILAVNWQVNGMTGLTRSPAFSVVGLTSDVETARAKLSNSAFNISSEIVSGNGSDSTVTSTSSSSHVGSVPTMTPTSTPTVSSGSSGGGLSTGAIIGIAVGVGVAALLAAAMGVFFFLRRRRRNSGGKGMDGASAEQEKLSSFMAVPKDVNANASDPAIAPYRDEHLHQTATTASAAAAAAGGAAATRDLDDYDDEAAPLDQPDRRRSESASRAAAAVTTQQQHGVSRHLVEDGMTDAEIQRLEEEERQLDDEIQRAGGRL